MVTLSIIAILAIENWHFFTDSDYKVNLWDFLTGTQWTPNFQDKHFGVLPLLVGTLHIAVISGLISIPIGLASGMYLSEYASPGLRKVVKPVLEVLAGVPTVVYGYFALSFITPYVIKKFFPEAGVYNALSAGIVVGIMILPLVASLCDDAFRAVPRSLREAGYAMGATKYEVCLQIVLPAAISGVLASFILALSRAVGETMAVTVAAGSTPNMTLNPLESIQTLTGFVASISMGDTPAGSIEYKSMFAVAGTLFVITLSMNWLAQRIMRRFREEYD
ncbi:phosphate ABC transporter permease subunit PstC [bacterium]|nr:phosphate ABC transporter permease subunit PstC [bacterium]